MEKPSQAILDDLKDHQGYKYMKFKIDKRMEDCKNKLLHAKTFDDVIKIQSEYETLKTVLNFAERP